MLIYNVTVSIDQQIEQDWLHWMRNTHILEVLQTGCFLECRLSRVNGEEEGGCTYSVMYLAPSEADYNHYQQQFAPKLQEAHTLRYQGKFAAFRTTLQVIEEFRA
jgi:hypothetical protein